MIKIGVHLRKLSLN